MAILNYSQQNRINNDRSVTDKLTGIYSDGHSILKVKGMAVINDLRDEVLRIKKDGFKKICKFMHEL